MQIIETVEEMQAHAEEARLGRRTLALVPTMGALHEGHLALVDEAGRRGDHLTVSIFVNPTQFGPGEDYGKYPRVLDDDLVLLDKTGEVDVVFAPSVEEMYPPSPEGVATWVTVDGLDEHLCGAHRPGHFRGVTSVVARLFNVCRPHVALFGLKDAQQFVILRQMVRDLHFGIELIGVPTVRESSGLALSSRNRYLTPSQKEQAVVLSEAVDRAARRVEEGEQAAEAIVQDMLQTIGKAPDAQVQYASLVDASSLKPVSVVTPGKELLAAVAVLFGSTRLIDSRFARAPGA